MTGSFKTIALEKLGLLQPKCSTDWHALLDSGYCGILIMLGIHDWRVYSWKRWLQMVLP